MYSVNVFLKSLDKNKSSSIRFVGSREFFWWYLHKDIIRDGGNGADRVLLWQQCENISINDERSEEENEGTGRGDFGDITKCSNN